AMILVDEKRLDLSQPVSSYLPAFHGGAKDRVTVEQLLTHSSGLDWWAPLYQDTVGPDGMVARVLGQGLVYPPGSKSVYSDLGFILLGAVVEQVAARPLDVLARERIWTPLGMEATTYLPPPGWRPRIAPTEQDPWR